MTTSSTANMTYTFSVAPVADANTATATPATMPAAYAKTTRHAARFGRIPSTSMA